MALKYPVRPSSLPVCAIIAVPRTRLHVLAISQPPYLVVLAPYPFRRIPLPSLSLSPSPLSQPPPSMSSEPDLPPHQLAIDDPHRIVRVVASDGKTNEQREIAYTNCKVIGNGSFGVVFQAKLVGEPKESEDIAIKKVLQDKRFKVGSFCLLVHISTLDATGCFTLPPVSCCTFCPSRTPLIAGLL